jgi:hypothetical protein
MAEPAVQEKERPIYRLTRDRIQVVISGYANAIFDAWVPPHVPPNDALRPEFWAHVVQEKGMQRGNFCYVRPDDNRWTLYVEVIDCGPNWLKARKCWLVEDDSAPPRDNGVTKGFSVAWQGQVNKYVVTRDSDKAVMSKGHKTEAAANIAMIEHARTVG